jgi:hypothetical protein
MLAARSSKDDIDLFRLSIMHSFWSVKDSAAHHVSQWVIVPLIPNNLNKFSDSFRVVLSLYEKGVIDWIVLFFISP